MITLGEKKSLQRFPRIWTSITGTTFFCKMNADCPWVWQF